MALESAAIPIPSEVVLPFSGFLVSSGRLNFYIIILVATFANLAGAIIVYWIGFWGGKPFLNRFGKYLLIHDKDVAAMERWTNHYHSRISFFSRLIPGVRTFSSLIIGVSRINFRDFVFYTFLGSLAWNLPLIYVGYVAGNNWNFLRPYFHKFELLIFSVILLGLIFFIFKHFRKSK